MRIALTGASGFIGAALARRFAQRGDEVTALMRTSSRRDHVEGHIDRMVVGPQDDRDAFAPLLDDADVLVHNSVDWKLLKEDRLKEHYDSNLAASLELIDEAAKRNIHIVYMSSVAVHHHMLDDWNGRIDHQHPTRPGNHYGALKAAVESHLWSCHATSGLTFSAIRPAAVYGQDPRIQRTIGYPILRAVSGGKPFERAGGGKFIHVEDVASATLAAADRRDGEPGIYHLAELYARWCDWAELACELLDTRVEIDRSSPEHPKNQFELTQLEDRLGIRLDRGLDGIREHLAELLERMREADLI
ncbi:MAG: hypothetical protein CMJ24_09865 [Phycisphaerae bacterium]|nr:hypothetical protein [Phycisphaerae bacterium]